MITHPGILMQVYRAASLFGFVVLGLACASSHPQSPAAGSTIIAGGEAHELIGTWRLVEFWDRDSIGTPKRYAYGEHPTGYFTYDATGHVSIQIQQGPAPPTVSNDRGEDWFQAATAEELRATVRAYRAYFGTYTVDRAAGIVFHQVEGDSRGLYTGSAQRRRFRLVNDSLVIGNDTTARRLLVRVR
jgi:hypothetical protein